VRDVVAAIRGLPGWLKMMLAGQFVSNVGGLVWLFMTLYLVDRRGMTAAAAGVVTACYGIGIIAGNLSGGWLGDRFGLRRTLLAAIGGWVVTCLAVPVTPVAALPAVTAAAGLLGGAGRPVSSALVALAVPGDLRRAGIALSRTVSNAGTMIGPPIGALLSAYNFEVVFVVDAMTSAVLWTVIWAKVPRVQGAARTVSGGLVRALRARPGVLGLLAAVVVVDTVYRLQYFVLPLWLRDGGQPALAYGLMISMNCVLIVLGEAAIAVRLRARPPMVVIGVGFALVGTGYLLLGTGFGLVSAVAMMAVVTAGEMLYKPTATAHVADAAPDGMAGRYQSLYGAASIFGMMLSPPLGTALYEAAPGAVWPVAGAAAIVVGVVTVLSDQRLPRGALSARRGGDPSPRGGAPSPRDHELAGVIDRRGGPTTP
jgi:MFS family permease